MFTRSVGGRSNEKGAGGEKALQYFYELVVHVQHRERNIEKSEGK